MSVMTEASIQSFTVDIPEEALDDLRRRIKATRWPTKELVGDRSQGVQLDAMQALARYWLTDYDWRTVEAQLKGAGKFDPASSLVVSGVITDTYLATEVPHPSARLAARTSADTSTSIRR